ncbi:MAG: hypothetical protein ACLQVN_09105 [Bryobacteraceae bacterium]
MRLSAKALAISAGLLWGGCLLLVGLINLAAPSYGADFLHGMGSIYPGFYRSHTFLDVLLGTLYALVDGAVGGWLIGWLYNCFAGPQHQSDSGAASVDRAA